MNGKEAGTSGAAVVGVKTEPKRGVTDFCQVVRVSRRLYESFDEFKQRLLH